MIYRAFGKRVLDIFVSLAALMLLSPLLLIAALLIKVFDPGPVIFCQNRIGRNGEPFVFYKFRSMPVNTGDIPSDRIGAVKIRPVGRFIRRTSIDELPQLFNILRGDMSIVGPRPPITSQIELIETRRANGALLCRPGLTGLAQICSFDGMTVSQKAAFDGTYARSVTFLGDVKIILGTFTYLLKPPPVY
ncbi:sugar transferase [Rheinheimera sp.]|uniref:sugar transferase n=1 Tax=Rheinheimera sp. TaxID=1869214 RepID=UPI0040489DDE